LLYPQLLGAKENFGREGIIAYEWSSHLSSNIKALQPGDGFTNLFDAGIGFKDPEFV
jgi:hypothetical protein